MKPVYYLILFLLYHCSVSGQTISNSFAKTNHFYSIFSFDAGNVYSTAANGTIEIQFPYQLINATGVVSDSVFHSRIISPFSKLKTILSFLDIELGSARQFYSIRISPYLKNDGSVSFLLGYGRNIYVGKSIAAANKAAFVFTPSLQIAYSDYRFPDNDKSSRYNYFGSIDNRDKNIRLLGYEADSVYHTTSGGNHNRKITNVNAETIDAFYVQHNLQLVPQVSIGNNPYRCRFHWQVDAGYYITLYERAGLLLLRNETDRLNKPDLINIRSNEITAMFNNQAVTKNPWQIGGLYVGIKAGIALTKHIRKQDNNKT